MENQINDDMRTGSAGSNPSGTIQLNERPQGIHSARPSVKDQEALTSSANKIVTCDSIVDKLISPRLKEIEIGKDTMPTSPQICPCCLCVGKCLCSRKDTTWEASITDYLRHTSDTREFPGTERFPCSEAHETTSVSRSSEVREIQSLESSSSGPSWAYSDQQEGGRTDRDEGWIEHLGESEDYLGESEEHLAYYPRGESQMKYFMRLLIEPLWEAQEGSMRSRSSYLSLEEEGLQRTIVIIKPEAVKFKETIYRVLFEEGFQILGSRVLHLTAEQVSEIYSKFYGSSTFPYLVASVSASPVIVLSISALNAIRKWLTIIGPNGSLQKEWFFPLSMQKLFGFHQTLSDCLHGSENLAAANKENRYFYPESIIEPLLEDEDKVADYCNLYLNPTILEACTEVVRKRPADPIIFFADYLISHNRFQPRFPQNMANTPT